MQSRPTEAPKDSSQANPPHSPTTSQYGFRPRDSQAPNLSSAGAGGDAASRSVSSVTTDPQPLPGASSSDRPLPEELRSESTPRTRSPVDRIIEYEKALAGPSRGTSQGLDFKVISSPREAGTESLGINRFPNGKVLISYKISSADDRQRSSLIYSPIFHHHRCPQ